MKVKYSTTWLADGGIEGTSGASWNGSQINDEVAFFRAAESSFFGRGGRTTTFTFRVHKTFDTHAALLLWAGTHFATLPEQADLIVTDNAGTVAIQLADAVVEQPRFTNVVGVSLVAEYTFKGGLFTSEDVPEDSVVPSAETMKSGTVTLVAGEKTGSVAFLVGFGAEPKVFLQVKPTSGGTGFAAWPVKGTVTAAGFDYRLAMGVPSSGTFEMDWVAIL